jgi:hypothetical protein
VCDGGACSSLFKPSLCLSVSRVYLNNRLLFKNFTMSLFLPIVRFTNLQHNALQVHKPFERQSF